MFNNNRNNNIPLFNNEKAPSPVYLPPHPDQNAPTILFPQNQFQDINKIFQQNSNEQSFQDNQLNIADEKKEEPKKKSLGELLYNKIKEAKESESLSYNSEYIQQRQDQKNKYKNYFEISTPSTININPNKNLGSIGSIKEYFHKTSFSAYPSKRLKANSFDISFSFNKENNLNNLMPNFENSFTKKLTLNNNLMKNNKKKIKITCQINEPKKASFTILIGKKVEMKKLKNTICEQLKKKNRIYANLNVNGFCLMKNYSFVQEFGLVENTNLSDGDDIFIILKDSMIKAQVNKEEKK